MKASYRCEICNKVYNTEDDANHCEAKGIEIPCINVGDVIYFKDCEETPVAYEKYHDIDNRMGDYVLDSDSFWKDIYYHNYDQIIKYTISKIEQDGHRLLYILKGKGNHKLFWREDKKPDINYPTLDKTQIITIQNASYNRKIKEE
jgi:hypothetical protein